MKVALGIESSNYRGMGHFFRSLLYIEYFKTQKIDFLYLINNDVLSLRILEEKKVNYIVVNYEDKVSNWESEVIKKNNIDVWFNDKFDTSVDLAKHVISNNVLFCCLDDIGDGAFFSDVYFAGMLFPSDKRKKGYYNFLGSKYITLNPEINLKKKIRDKVNKVLVTLGGSDPFGVTLEVVKVLIAYDYEVTVLIGPNFKFEKELKDINIKNYKIVQNVPSLIEFFTNFDIAITGGGVTCCEANASGLPCYIIANADHEINTGKYMQQLGGSIYLGSHGLWDKSLIGKINSSNVQKMSKKGIANFDTLAVERIFIKIKTIWEKQNEN